MNDFLIKFAAKLLKNGEIDRIREMNLLVEAGNAYELGIDIEKDTLKAIDLYKESALNYGNVDAMILLGNMYLEGKGVKKDFYEAERWYQLADKEGNLIAKLDLINMYYCGKLGYRDNFKKAYNCLRQLELEEDGQIHEQLGNLYLHGRGTSRDFKKAKYHFNKALEYNMESCKYLVDIFQKMENEGKKEILVIKNTAEFREEDMKDDIGAILITSDTNIDFFGQTLYDRQTFLKIIKIMNGRLKQIDEIDSNGTNEVNVFNQICKQIVNDVVYDDVEADTDNGENIYTSRCLCGATLTGKAVCTGIIEYFRNMCACRKIECIIIDSEDHTFCQVKLKGSWYYFDLTNAMDFIKQGDSPELFLLSEKVFLKRNPALAPMASQITYSSDKNFISKKIEDWLTNFGTEERNLLIEKIKKLYEENYSAYLELIIHIITGEEPLSEAVEAAERYMSFRDTEYRKPDSQMHV